MTSRKGKFTLSIYFSLSDSGTTHAPAVPVQHTYTFNLGYSAKVDCTNVETIYQIRANLYVTIRARLRNLVKRFSKLCNLPEISNCFVSITLHITNCNRAILMKRATEPSTIDAELNIPDMRYV